VKATDRRAIVFPSRSFVASVALWLVVLPGVAAGQGRRGVSNPLARDAAAVQAGRELFLKRCAVCHGQDATGGMAANLVRSSAVASGSDAALFRLITEGIPGTEMPPQADLDEQGVWGLVSYLQNLARPGLQPPVAGDVQAGQDVFLRSGCSGCHRVDGEGGFLGPALDSIAARKTSSDIRRDILDPNAVVREGYRSVVATTKGGARIAGLLKNEDSFSLQIMARDGAFRLLARSEIRELEKSSSPMPSDYADKLSREQLQNLLAFLDRRRDPFITIERGFQNY
jgi:putative heme-binding domain-containing protein